MKCIKCDNKKLDKIVDIGNQVISSLFYKKPEFNLKKYSLDLFECSECKLVQLKELAPLNKMYGTTYGYRTSLSPLMIKHMRIKFLKILKNKGVKKKSNILDIGCNDGTFLNFFGKKGFANLYGIDPSAKKFIEFHHKNIKLANNFFSLNNVYKNFDKISFDLITSFAMFYDISKPNAFCNEIRKLLSKNGIWILELSYWPSLIENMTYDQICHEHIAYYSLTVFKKLVEKNGLKIIDFSFNEINGGSIEIICSKKLSKHKVNNKKINKQIEYEKKINRETYDNLNLRISNTSKTLLEFLQNIKKSKKTLIGYGAATKGNIVLNQIKANRDIIPYIADANPEKFNKYTPGTNIKIISKNKMRKMKPDYLLVLIWSFRSEVIKQEINYIKKGGKLIFHLPTLHIIDKDNYKNYINKGFDTFSFKI
ncbi:class I SAM-dependent methyltransferase [Candidatus Pelagibacter sp.]|nr:class I SAM-dependent methyltransferase [Candidatus Pelagibacter sp.]